MLENNKHIAENKNPHSFTFSHSSPKNEEFDNLKRRKSTFFQIYVASVAFTVQ